MGLATKTDVRWKIIINWFSSLKKAYLPSIDFLQNEFLIWQLVNRRPSLVLRFDVGVSHEVIVTRLPTWPVHILKYNLISIKLIKTLLLDKLRFELDGKIV